MKMTKVFDKTPQKSLYLYSEQLTLEYDNVTQKALPKLSH